MQRRQFTQSTAAIGLLILATHQQARALSLGDLTEGDASKGIKVALEKGALAAVALLGKTDGFLGNPKVRIPLPGFLEDASKLLKLTGVVDSGGAGKAVAGRDFGGRGCDRYGRPGGSSFLLLFRLLRRVLWTAATVYRGAATQVA